MQVDVETLHKLLICDAENGTLTWRERTPDMFENAKFPKQICASWNGRYAGKLAFTANSDGYRIGAIFDRLQKSHRIIWAMTRGEWPRNQIDHIDGDRGNNRIENLRDVTNQENAQNITIPSDNTSGTIGVTWCKKNGSWKAQIGVNQRLINLGYFDAKADAINARKLAEREYGFHKHHGRTQNAD